MKKITILTLFFLSGLLIPGIFTILFTGRMEGNQKKMGIQVRLSDGTELDGEEFVTGMAASQISSVREEEAMKAWMIVCRTNFLKKAGNKKTVNEKDLELDYISPGEMEQNNGKKAWFTYRSLLMEASRETFGQVLVYHDELIDAVSHQVSTGRTVSSKEIYSVDVPYLVSVDSSQDVESPDYLGIRTISYKECARILSKNGQKESEKSCRKNLAISKKTENGYVVSIGTKKNTWTGDQWKDMFGLNSTCFYLENHDDKLRIVTLGKGHGMGMSLYGANVMGRKRSAEEILGWYYPGTKVKNCDLCG